MGKAIKLNNKKTGELLYPMTASDMVFDPETKKSVMADLAEKIGDAPSDGKSYIRKSSNWEPISTEETCRIILKSNQGDSDIASLAGVSVKVIATEDSSELFNGVWNGEAIVLSIQEGTEYKVVAGSLEDYATPAEQIFTASAFSSRNITMIYSTELVSVTLSAEDGSDVSGQIVTINGIEHTYNGVAIEQKVAFGTKYSITASAKTNYTTPTAITNRTASQASYPVTMEYKLANETLTVNVSGSLSGFTITVKDSSGTVLGTSTSATKAFSIAKGTVYYVYASSMSGYTVTESFGPFTAVAGGSRTVSVVYAYRPGTTSPSNGVYIKDTEGYYHTADEWDGTYTADCVAVITSNCRFGIALTEASNTMEIHNDNSEALENYMTAISDGTQAKADYDGATNTTNIMKVQSDTGYAAGWCNAFSFPSGKNGFLPSLGQMWAAYSNKSAVDAALTKAGGTALTSAYYWTSTFWGVGGGGDRGCWLLSWSGGNVSSGDLSTTGRVRAFSAL